MTSTIEWTKQDSLDARCDGWDIFQADRTSRGPYILAKLDDPGAWDDLDYEDPKFEYDEDVWLHVTHQAAEGGELHAKALAHLREINQIEYDAVLAELKDKHPGG